MPQLRTAPCWTDAQSGLVFSIQASYFATSWKVPVTVTRAEALHKGCRCSYADIAGRPAKLSLGTLHGQAGSRRFVSQLSSPTDPSVGSFAVVSGPLPSREELSTSLWNRYHTMCLQDAHGAASCHCSHTQGRVHWRCVARPCHFAFACLRVI